MKSQTKKKRNKTVTQREIVKRINEALAPEHTVLRASRREASELGPWYAINSSLNALMFHYKQLGAAELTTIARDLNVIESWEVVAT